MPHMAQSPAGGLQRPGSSRIGVLCSLAALFLLPWNPLRAAAEQQPCLECHRDLVGARNIHPAAEMGCAVCHDDPHAGEKAVLSLVQNPPDLCLMCHDQKILGGKVKHPPAASGQCTACHNPHSSPNPRLFTARLPDLCFGCHTARPFARRVKHAPVAAGQCLTCHEAHSSPVESVLKTPVGELCVGCHRRQSTGTHVLTRLAPADTHPLTGVPDPRRAGRQLSCVSCHVPHSADSRLLFAGDAPNPQRLCLWCHQKISIPMN
jgi:predicted CXXCH cytochrome family protein